MRDSLSRIPHAPRSAQLRHTEALSLTLPKDLIPNYDLHATFTHIRRSIRGNLPGDSTQRHRINRLLPLFRLADGRLFHENKLCVPRQNVRDSLHLDHGSPTSGHFSSTKTISRLVNFHWRHKSHHVRSYYHGFLTSQQEKDRRSKQLGIPQPLQFPNRHWGSIAIEFITHLPSTPRGHDAISSFFVRFSRRVHFVPS